MKADGKGRGEAARERIIQQAFRAPYIYDEKWLRRVLLNHEKRVLREAADRADAYMNSNCVTIDTDSFPEADPHVIAGVRRAIEGKP